VKASSVPGGTFRLRVLGDVADVSPYTDEYESIKPVPKLYKRHQRLTTTRDRGDNHFDIERGTLDDGQQDGSHP
jgi:hypothetical protein